MLQFEELVGIARAVCKNGDPVSDENCTPKAIKIAAADLKNVCLELYQNSSTYFDMLSCITAIDNGPQAATMELIYNLYSVAFNHHLTLKIVLPRENPEIESMVEIWRTADWHEREAYDMFGIRFRGHPDLRRILLPADWEGFPLLKDYKQQEYYRNIKVEY